jgi:hypothetical protein
MQALDQLNVCYAVNGEQRLAKALEIGIQLRAQQLEGSRGTGRLGRPLLSILCVSRKHRPHAQGENESCSRDC